jgi:large subunit ribosomal protein L9
VKVVLRADVTDVGKRGDIVNVADGFARNYLIATGRAIRATDGIVAQAASMRRSRDITDANDRGAAEAVAQQLVAQVISIPARAGREGRLFGSVTASDIVGAVENQSGIAIDRHKLVIREPIKAVGVHTVSVRLHVDVEFELSVDVVASAS